MEKKEKQSRETQRMQEAVLLFRQLSPEKRAEILEIVKRLAGGFK